MDLVSHLDKDLSQALKDKNELAVLTLRQIKSAITNAEIAQSREKLTPDQLTKLLRTEVKKRREAAELYQQGGRDDLVTKENNEIEIVSKYLPAELGEDIIKQKITQVIEKVGAQGPQDTGKVMGGVMEELAGQADGGIVSKLVKEQLAQKQFYFFLAAFQYKG